MKIEFVYRDNTPEKLVCEAELLFLTGPLAGFKLVGFALWRGGDKPNDIYVTFPSRPFGSGSERKYFDYLRAIDFSSGVIGQLKQQIVAQYCKEHDLPIPAPPTTKKEPPAPAAQPAASRTAAKPRKPKQQKLFGGGEEF